MAHVASTIVNLRVSFVTNRSMVVFWILGITISLLLIVNMFAALPASLRPRQSPQPLDSSELSPSSTLRVAISLAGYTPLNATFPSPSSAPLPSLIDYALENCLPFRNVYSQLLHHNLGQTVSNASITAASGHHIYVHNNRLLLDRHADRKAAQPVFATLKQLLSKTSLPNLALPVSFNPATNATHNHTATVAFCTTLSQTDILLPELLPDDYSRQSPAATKMAPTIARAVWRGEAVAFGGWHESRTALLQYGKDHPHLLDSGIGSWLEQAPKELLPDRRWLKQAPDTEENEAMFKYTVWAPGDCYKLASRIASGVLVFLVEGGEQQWFSPLLKPFIHYVPIKINSSYTNLRDMMAWAAEHKYAAGIIPEQAKELADLYLGPLGRECYALQTLFRLTKRGFGNFALPASSQDVSACDDLRSCAAI